LTKNLCSTPRGVTEVGALCSKCHGSHVSCAQRLAAAPLGFAGSWETWHKNDQPIETTALLTTTPNELTSEVHNRMPVILQPEFYDDWLSPEMQDVERFNAMLLAYPAREMEAVDANDYVNNARHEGPECLAA
jgi:putative SOS response-associated peptidase YedK